MRYVNGTSVDVSDVRRDDAIEAAEDPARDVVAAENSVRAPTESIESFFVLRDDGGTPLKPVPPKDFGANNCLEKEEMEAGEIGLIGA